MTNTQAIKTIKAMPNMTARHSVGNEIRVNYRFAHEDSAYYTNSVDDAIKTAEDYVHNHEQYKLCEAAKCLR